MELSDGTFSSYYSIRLTFEKYEETLDKTEIILQSQRKDQKAMTVDSP